MEAKLQHVRSEVTGRAVRLPGVCDLTGVSRTTIWRWVKDDPSFPKPFRLSAAVTCWDEDEILEWITSKKDARRGSVGQREAAGPNTKLSAGDRCTGGRAAGAQRRRISGVAAS
jgi:predicted DNA-binding transcriptional regulator AlpA